MTVQLGPPVAEVLEANGLDADDVRDNEFSIQTFEFEGFPDVVSIESIRFEDLGNGRTKLHGHSVYPSVEARDGMVASNMEAGMAEGYERLDKVLTDI